MPLDPNKLYQKKPNEPTAIRPAILLAIEWSAITFAGMLAVLFLCWALALQSSPDSGGFTATQAYHSNGDDAHF